jgi:tetratricopeptide (TPR) repeat protein
VSGRAPRALTLALCAALACSKPPPPSPEDAHLEADGLYLRGQTAYLQGKFAEAHLAFAEVRKLNPTDRRLPSAEAEVYLSESKLDDALPLFEAAVKADPSRGTVWSRLAAIYAIKKQPQKASEAVAKALALNPADSNALETRADLEAERGAIAEAARSLVAAAALAPAAAKEGLITKATQLLGKHEQPKAVLPMLEAAWDAGITGPLVASELGDQLVGAGRLEEAIGAYTRAAEQSPADPSLWELVGELHRQLNRPKEAEAAYRRSLALKDRGVVHAELARLCLAAKDQACVSAELNKALEKSTGESLRETLELAELLKEVGRKKDSLALLRTVAEEPESKGDLELQLKTARLAAEVKDAAAMRAACARVLAKLPPGGRCP